MLGLGDRDHENIDPDLPCPADTNLSPASGSAPPPAQSTARCPGTEWGGLQNHLHPVGGQPKEVDMSARFVSMRLKSR